MFKISKDTKGLVIEEKVLRYCFQNKNNNTNRLCLFKYNTVSYNTSRLIEYDVL